MWGKVRPGSNKNNEIQRKNRGRPPGRKNTAVRADRQEACQSVAQALVQEPTATIARLASLAWPEAQGDVKSKKAAHERARQALADLKRAAWLAGDARLEEKVREALAAREAAEAERREERARREQERKERRREWEKRFRMQPARLMLQRLLRLPEIQEEFARQVRARRRFVAVGEENTRSFMLSMPFSASQILPPPRIPHPRAGLVGRAASEGWRVGMELRFARLVTSLATISADSAWDILASAKALRHARRKGDAAAEARAAEALRRAVSLALPGAGWADPELPAGQVLESPAARAAREKATRQEAAAWAEAAAALEAESLADPADGDAGPELEIRDVSEGVTVEEEDRDEAAEIAEEVCGYVSSLAASASQAGEAIKWGQSGFIAAR